MVVARRAAKRGPGDTIPGPRGSLAAALAARHHDPRTCTRDLGRRAPMLGSIPRDRANDQPAITCGTNRAVLFVT
jgi:hypothetical protein